MAGLTRNKKRLEKNFKFRKKKVDFLKCAAVIINLDVQFGSETFSGVNPINEI
jgi:hypothetical protein